MVTVFSTRNRSESFSILSKTCLTVTGRPNRNPMTAETLLPDIYSQFYKCVFTIFSLFRAH